MTTPVLSDADIAKLEAKAAKAKKEQQEAEEALAKAYESRKAGSIQRVNDLITELKLTVDDIASISIVKDAIKKALKTPAKAPATTAKGNTSTYVAPPAKWRYTDGSTYGGGRGPVPKWVEAARANNTLDNYLIDKSTKPA